jgi:hypothetical protein
MLKRGHNEPYADAHGTKSFARQNKQFHKNGVPGGRAAAESASPFKRRRVFV